MMRLVWINLMRNKLRTLLTLASVFAALFLYSSLGAVLDTFQSAADAGSRERLAVRHAIALTNFLPGSYKSQILAIPGVRRVCTQTWFGGIDPQEPKALRQRFAVDDDFWPMYRRDLSIVAWSPPQARVAVPAETDPHLAAYLTERTACIVGESLMRQRGWRLGQTIHLEGTLFRGTWDFVIRGAYATNKNAAWPADLILFHKEYLQERALGGQDFAGVFKVEIADPSQSAAIAKQIDARFENSDNPTKTESEQAFASGFISMFGNVGFALRMIGFAVVFTILVISANTMIMALRERTSEIGVLKTLGFTDGAIFSMVVIEAAIITTGGGLAAALVARLGLDHAPFPIFNTLVITWGTVFTAVAIAVGLGVVSGFIPAWQASRLRIVDALRRVD